MGTRKITGLHQRDGSGAWWLRVMIPKDLQAQFYQGKDKLRESLGTTDGEKARVLALARHAHYASEFDRQRAQLKPTALAEINPALTDLLAARVRHSILVADDAVRFYPEMLAAFLTAFRAMLIKVRTGTRPA